MQIDRSVLLCVLCKRTRGVPPGTRHRHSPRDLLGANCQSRRGDGKAAQILLFHQGGRSFPPLYCRSVNLQFFIKRDYTANVKYTLCVIIKY